MKNTGMIISSIIGGAILGSAVTMMVCPKSGKELRKEMNETLVDSLKQIHEHIKKCKCLMGMCDEGEKSEQVTM